MKIDRLDHAPQRPQDAERATMPRPTVVPRTQQRIAQSAAVIVLAVLLLLPVVLPSPRAGLAIDIGAEIGLNDFGESREGFYLFDVNPPEQDATGTTYRWTKSFSTLRFLNLFAVGSPLLLDLRACGCRPAATDPVTATLKLNSNKPLSLPLNGQFRSYRFLVPYERSDYGDDLYLEVRGNTFRLPNDDRDLGFRLDHASVAPIDSSWSIMGLSPVFAWLLYGLALIATWALPSSLVTRHSSIITRHSSIVLVAVALLAVPFFYRPHLFSPFLIASLSLVAIWGALLVGRNLLHRIALAFAGLWMVWSSQILGFWILDDAYISFRYAANMLAGQGIVFNPGERVEGYTNFLWTMIMALPLALDLDPTLPSAILTLFIGLGIVWLVYYWGVKVWSGEASLTAESQSSIANLQSPLLLFAPLMLAVSTPFLLYTARGSGMETALFTLLLAAGSFAVQRAADRRGLFVAGALLALATMTRPDGVLGVAAAGGYLLVQAFSEKQFRFNIMVLCMASLTLGFAVLFVPYYLWRFLYYGYPLPNTFYAKVGSGWAQTQRGLDYFGDFAATVGWRFVALIAILGIVATLWNARKRLRSSAFVLRPLILHLIALIALYSVYTVYVGGDHFPGFRFFVPILPFLALLIQQALRSIAATDVIGQVDAVRSHSVASRVSRFMFHVSPLAALALGALYLAFTAYQLPASDIGIGWSPVRGEYNVVEKNRELGLWLRDNTPPDTVVATGIAGALPFYSGLRVIDTLGLNDLHIAHLDVGEMGSGVAGAEKTDVPYVLDQQPEYIPYSTSGTFQGYARFKSDYRLIEVRGPEGRAIKLYVSHDIK